MVVGVCYSFAASTICTVVGWQRFEKVDEAACSRWIDCLFPDPGVTIIAPTCDV